MARKAEKKKRGGARPGAGRPCIGDQPMGGFWISLPVDIIAEIERRAEERETKPVVIARELITNAIKVAAKRSRK